MSVGAQIIAETTLLADAIRTAPHAKVRKYPNWNLAELGRHVGEIHGWATGLVRSAATERQSRPRLTEVPDDEIAGVLHVGAVALAEVLDGCDLDGQVWSFTGMTTNAFWCRRMLNETTIHRWDAQDAIGRVTVVSHEVAVDGIDEALSSYLAGAAPDWTVTADGPAIAVSVGERSCRISGGAVDLWLLTMGRRPLKGFEVAGDGDLAKDFADLAVGLRGPAG